jgi:hypothetical protein
MTEIVKTVVDDSYRLYRVLKDVDSILVKRVIEVMLKEIRLVANHKC